MRLFGGRSKESDEATDQALERTRRVRPDLLDEDGRFYFLEMNTRLQVEHPVTELVTGRDLVHAQLRIAGGEPLWFTQADVAQRGHAIECRIYAEDAARGLLPQSGTLLRYAEPQGPGIRVDSGVREGQTIGVDYDPMLAKLIVHAETREAALARLVIKRWAKPDEVAHAVVYLASDQASYTTGHTIIFTGGTYSNQPSTDADLSMTTLQAGILNIEKT